MAHKNPEDAKAYRRRYYEANREALARRYKEYRQNNKEKLCEQKKAYYQGNKDAIKANNKEYRNKRRLNTKIRAIEYKGGKCELCGYNKCRAALEFHHLDPSEKDPRWDKSMKSWSFESVKAELDKCMLLCANCHAEIHNPGLVVLAEDPEVASDAIQDQGVWDWMESDISWAS